MSAKREQALLSVLTFLCATLLSLAAFADGFVARPPAKDAAPNFKFHLKHEPTLDPTAMTPGEATYVFSNLYRGLTRYKGGTSVVFETAERCTFKTEKRVACKLRKGSAWNDGKPVTAAEFVDGFKRLLSPESRCPVVDLLFGIKNARDVFAGKLSVEKLGLRAVSDHDVEFELEKNDPEFFEKLSNPLFVPYRKPSDAADKTSYFFNGPYKVKIWESDRRIVLSSNEYYLPEAAKRRPDVEVVFAKDDSAGINLYEKGVINFLWRLTALNIPKYKDRPDFVQIPQARFDYVGFNLRPGSPFADKKLRRAFAHAVNFEDFKKIFFALGAPGCPGLGEEFMSGSGHCVVFDPAQPRLVKADRPALFMFSQLGGDDIRRAAEWFQEQWREHLGASIELKDMEQKQYRSLLHTSPPDIFRVGVMLDRPTCLAALEKFVTGGAENYTGFDNAKFNKLAARLGQSKLSSVERARLCGEASDILFKEEFVGIPLGRIHFTMLVDPHFKGWHVNELNQLDLSDLHYEK